MTRTSLTSRQHRLLISAVVLAVAVTAFLALAVQPANAQATVEMGELQIADVNQTVDGDVSDVTVDTTLAYNHSVPDATTRILKLQAGPTRDQLTELTFAAERDVAGTDAGTVDLSASLLEADGITASDLNPAIADTTETTVYVAATIEVKRENGESVTRTVVEPVTLTLTDGATLDVAVGGEGSLTVETV
jgi:hypothetical protein